MGTLSHRQLQSVTREGRIDPTDWESSSAHLIDDEPDIEVVSSVTYVVAASNANERSIHRADYQCDGTADDVQIQAAIGALPTGGGRVVLSEGTFAVTTQITVGSNTIIEGQGIGNTILQVSSQLADQKAIFNNSGASSTLNSHIYVRDLTIDCNSLATIGIHFQEVDRSSIDRVEIKNFTCHPTPTFAIGIWWGDYSAATENLRGCYIRDCEIHDGTGGTPTIPGETPGAFGMWPNSEGFNHGGIFNNRIWSMTGDGIVIDDEMRGTTVAFNEIYSCNYGIGCPAGNDYDSLILLGNYCHDNTYEGIESSSPIKFSTISSNITVDNGRDGIYIFGAGEELVLVNNIAESNTRNGIAVVGANHAIVNGNNCRNNGNGSDPSYGIWIDDSTYCLISNNICYDDQTPATQTYGIYEQSTSDNNLIANNMVDGNKTGTIVKAGTSTIVRDNTGYITENSGTSSITSGDTTKVVAHGLSATPTIININFREQGTADYGRWWVSSIGTTNFTLNVSVDPGASNLDFAWEAKVR